MSGSLSSAAGGPRALRTPLPARCCECPGVPLVDEEGGTCCRCGKYLASDLANTSRQDPDEAPREVRCRCGAFRLADERCGWCADGPDKTGESMKKLAGAALVAAAVIQLTSTARVLMIAAMFRWLPAEMRDGHAAWLSIEAAIAAEAEMIA